MTFRHAAGKRPARRAGPARVLLVLDIEVHGVTTRSANGRH